VLRGFVGILVCCQVPCRAIRLRGGGMARCGRGTGAWSAWPVTAGWGACGALISRPRDRAPLHWS